MLFQSTFSHFQLKPFHSALLPGDPAHQTRRVAHVDLVPRWAGGGRTVPVRDCHPETGQRRRGGNKIRRKSAQHPNTPSQSKKIYNEALSSTSGQYYKHMTIVDDDSSVIIKWSSKLIDAARGVIYDHHMFIVQATDGSTIPKYKLLCFKPP